MAEGLERESAYEDARDTSVRRTAVTIRGEGVAPMDDSLFGEDEELATRGPEWCIDSGSEILAMNKFELWLALGAGDYSPTTLVWKVGRERWQPAQEIPDLACALKLHAQTLLAADRLGRDAQAAPIPTEAATPRSPTTHVASIAEQDTLLETPSASLPLVGTAMSDRPLGPTYIVRGPRPKRRTDIRVQLITGLAAVGALAATALLLSGGHPRAALATTSLAAEAAAILSPPAETPAVGGQSLTLPASMKVESDPGREVGPARRVKTISPTHRGQERAHRKGR